MKLHHIRGGNLIDLENKNYTIGIGISLGNKWFTPENIVEQIKWALQYSKKEVVVYVADSIHTINIMVRSRKSLNAATKIVQQAGDQLFTQIKNLTKDLTEEEQKRLVFVKWDEMIDDKFTIKLEYLRSCYAEPGPFQEMIRKVVREHVSKEDRKFSEEDIHGLGSYIVEELPVCLSRVSMRNILVDAYTYPYDNKITQFTEQIQMGEIFPEIKEKVMDTEPKVFLEVR